MDQDVSQWTTTAVNTTCSSINSLDYRKSSAKFDVTSCGTTETTFGFEFNFSKVKQIKLRLLALSKRLKESRKEKADLMKRIGNMEIQLMHLKDVRGVGDQIFHKDISEKSRIHLINLITDAKEMMENEKTENEKSEEKIRKKKSRNRLFEMEEAKIQRVPSPAQAIPFEPEAKQKWLRRMLAGKTGVSLPSVSESQRIVYSKRPNVVVCPVESQHSQLTKNQCSSIPSESNCKEPSTRKSRSEK